MNSTAIAPVRRSVGVDCPVEQAFEVFTAGIYSWWPTETHSIGHAAVRDVVFEGQVGGQVYEVVEDGSKHVWAEVLVWEPPHRLVLGWDVAGRGTQTEVEVRFTPYEDGNGTHVELEHRAWERWEDGADARNGYDTGWEFVLGRFAESAGLAA